ncbi:hypothetical protein PPERSA_00845 [Pseudocohnilembus persalinus]|uniref:Peptidase S9 prolyl oligopeptidase catalytic domain-containing protein n=1 Tax=Pseudocohnilembus persalinus TaxID=266149 RepID=A0A0V0R778_PSEPJ|nr:hypothetical protein PPERSA_00845 [Pseudocohnilembus persalinus]|eukprot:KRX10365.1 hypothetical protein PPERSA_00845 [Pseudocohnilembus persalinus]
MSATSVYVKNIKVKSEYLVIFSHGNSTDNGWMIDSYLDIGYNCKINLLGYDYSGYGISEGKLGDCNMLEDIKSVYLFARNQLKFEWNKIIIYGQSLGSGPSTYICSQEKFPVAGLIFHSGFTSGLRLMIQKKNVKKDANEDEKINYYDFFPNIQMLKSVNCPVLFIHGTHDEEIPFYHCEDNSQQVKIKQIFKVINGGHNNIETDFRREYFAILKDFLKKIKQKNEENTQAVIYKQNKAGQWDDNFKHLYVKQNQVKIDQKYNKKLSQSSIKYSQDQSSIGSQLSKSNLGMKSNESILQKDNFLNQQNQTQSLKKKLID